MAGALGVQLGGVNAYDGLVEERAQLGDPGGPLISSQIPIAVQVMGLASLLFMLVLFAGVVW